MNTLNKMCMIYFCNVIEKNQVLEDLKLYRDFQDFD